MRISVQVSAGELIDRITILEIKLRRLPRTLQPGLAQELARLREIQHRTLTLCSVLEQLTDHLRATNRELWDVEEELRECETRRDFGPPFVELARAVYKTNDRRAALKARIDALVGSTVREWKSHPLPEV